MMAIYDTTITIKYIMHIFKYIVTKKYAIGSLSNRETLIHELTTWCASPTIYIVTILTVMTFIDVLRIMAVGSIIATPNIF